MQAIRLIFSAAAAMMVLVASTASTAVAQGGQGGGGRMNREAMQQRQNELLFKDITLTDAQKARIDSIQTTARAAAQELMQSGGMRDSTTRAKRMELRTRERVDIRAVLTAAQQVTFDKNVAAMSERRGRRPTP